jgi:pimeloyl-ACP methyl ester carboxylesterase
MNPSPFIEGRPLDIDLPLHVTEVPGTDRPAEVFLMLHGFGGSSFSWRSWAPRLAARGRVLCVDYKGFGAAPKPPDDRYAPDDQADLVIALIDRLGLERVTLIGHSLGGSISLLACQALSTRSASAVERLVMIASPAYRQRVPPFVALSKRPRLSRALVRSVGPQRLVRAILRSVVYDPAAVTDERVSAYAHPLMTAEGLDGVLRAGRHILPKSLERTAERVRDVTIPTLLMWGDRDRVVPGWVGERLAEELTDARLVVLERCGHIPPEEHPDISFAHLTAFLDETDG